MPALGLVLIVLLAALTGCGITPSALPEGAAIEPSFWLSYYVSGDADAGNKYQLLITTDRTIKPYADVTYVVSEETAAKMLSLLASRGFFQWEGQPAEEARELHELTLLVETPSATHAVSVCHELPDTAEGLKKNLFALEAAVQHIAVMEGWPPQPEGAGPGPGEGPAGAARDRAGEGVLLADALRGDADALRILLGEDPDLIEETFGEDGASLLHLAAGRGAIESMRLLLGRGTDANVRDRRLRTPLHYAAEEGQEEAVRLLAERGAEVNAQDEQGWTPMRLAVHGGNVEVLRLLADRGAETDIFAMAALGDVDRTSALLDEDPALVKARDETTSGFSPLHYAAQYGRRELAELLLAKGADPEGADALGTTPLRIAATGGHKEVADALMDSGAKVDIFVASAFGDVESTRRLLQEDPGRANARHRSTPLRLAAERGHVEVIEFLLAAGADVNAETFEGTPLHGAAAQGHKAAVELLLAGGADVNVRDRDGWTPLHCAAYYGHRDIAELLLARGADLDVHTAASLGRDEVLATLLRVRPQFAASRFGAAAGTALHWAARAGQVEAVKLLLAAGADARAGDSKGKTPVAWALETDQQDAATVLREHLAGE